MNRPATPAAIAQYFAIPDLIRVLQWNPAAVAKEVATDKCTAALYSDGAKPMLGHSRRVVPCEPTDGLVAALVLLHNSVLLDARLNTLSDEALTRMARASHCTIFILEGPPM